METYRVHTLSSAPDRSKPALEKLREAFGAIPNLAATMAESPVLLNGFVGAFGNFHGGRFSSAERQVLLLTNAVGNRCAWAVAFHSAMALKEGVAPPEVAAIREGRLPAEPRLAALSGASRALQEKRGHVEARELAGLSPEEVLEVVAGIAVSAMANYAGNLTSPPLEPAFQGQAWSSPAR